MSHLRIYTCLPAKSITAISATPGSAVAGAARVVARAGGNITVACGGVSSSSYIYLVEWVCSGCSCAQCPAHSNTGLRLLRYNDKITQVS